MIAFVNLDRDLFKSSLFWNVNDDGIEIDSDVVG